MEAKGPLRDVEAERLGTSHDQVGQWIAEKWGFPDLIATVIGRHYSASVVTGWAKTEVSIVALANTMSLRAGYGSAGDPETDGHDRELLRTLEITEQVAEEVVEELEGLREETHQFLNLLSKDH